MRNLILTIMLSLCAVAVQAQTSCTATAPWHDWEQFQRMMISGQGRVIDASDPRHITTSEGQSYAMFFALVNNDRLLFRRLVRWTENNLAQGDLTVHLPAWLWGRNSEGLWQVLDANTASDSNLWIAYSLLEAGRLWDEHSYTVLGHLILQRMAKEEVVNVPGFGYLLAPGKHGFSHQNTWRFNPSYLPPQLLARIAQTQPATPWAELLTNTPRFLIETAPLGLAPDWVSYTGGWTHQHDDEQVGSYDAIRVYLWVGMLHPDSAHGDTLKAHFKRGLLSLAKHRLPAEKMGVLQSSAQGVGPSGFSAALLPLLSDTPLAQEQHQRLQHIAQAEQGYYNQVLLLFGKGWEEKRYFFDQHGYLVPAWAQCNE